MACDGGGILPHQSQLTLRDGAIHRYPIHGSDHLQSARKDAGYFQTGKEVQQDPSTCFSRWSVQSDSDGDPDFQGLVGYRYSRQSNTPSGRVERDDCESLCRSIIVLVDRRAGFRTNLSNCPRHQPVLVATVDDRHDCGLGHTIDLSVDHLSLIFQRPPLRLRGNGWALFFDISRSTTLQSGGFGRHNLDSELRIDADDR